MVFLVNYNYYNVHLFSSSLNFTFTQVLLKNQEDAERTVHVRLSAVASFYTGVPSQNVGTSTFNETLAAKEGLYYIL